MVVNDLRLNLDVGINLKLSIPLTDRQTIYLNKHRKNIENKILNMVDSEFGSDYVGEDGYQKVTVNVYQNELTDL